MKKSILILHVLLKRWYFLVNRVHCIVGILVFSEFSNEQENRWQHFILKVNIFQVWCTVGLEFPSCSQNIVLKKKKKRFLSTNVYFTSKRIFALDHLACVYSSNSSIFKDVWNNVILFPEPFEKISSRLTSCIYLLGRTILLNHFQLLSKQQAFVLEGWKNTTVLQFSKALSSCRTEILN